MDSIKPHPARYTKSIMATIEEKLADYLQPGQAILDPFAGTGLLLGRLAIKYQAVGIELEPEWALQSPQVRIGDALNLGPDLADYFDAVVTSPAYGNRMADHHEAKDTSKRNTYRHQLGRPLSPNSSGKMQWGIAYQEFHAKAWAEVYRVLKPSGYFFINVKNHIRKGEVIDVAGWHFCQLQENGFNLIKDPILIRTPGNRFGRNGQARVDHELLAVFQKENK